MKRLLITVLIFAMMISVLPAGVPAFAYADDGSSTEEAAAAEKDTITVKGIQYNKNNYSKSYPKDTIYVTGARGKKIELQQMITKGTWTTVSTYTAYTDSKAAVVLRYPKRTKTYTYWRIHIAGDSTTKTYNSGLITVISRNIKNVKLNARSACIYCMDTGEFIYSKKMTKKLPMASTTKIMTAVIVMENMSMNKKVKISKRASKTPYRNLYMKKGDKYYVKDLFRAMLVSSSNDSARALAENTAGSSKKFVKKMNAKAKVLGLTKTHYSDEVGFYSSTRSSAKDLARLMTYGYQSEIFRKSIGKKTYKFKNVKKTRKHKVWSSSYNMYSYSKNYLGGKTGTTTAARCCFVGVYRYGGRTYVCVNMGSKNNYYRWRDSKRLYRYIKKYARLGTMGGITTEEPEEELVPEDDGTTSDDSGDNGSGDSGSGDGTGDDSGETVIPGSDGEDGEVLSITE